MTFLNGFGGLKSPLFTMRDPEDGNFLVASIYDAEDSVRVRVFGVEQGTKSYRGDTVVLVDDFDGAVAYIDDAPCPFLYHGYLMPSRESASKRLVAEGFELFGE